MTSEEGRRRRAPKVREILRAPLVDLGSFAITAAYGLVTVPAMMVTHSDALFVELARGWSRELLRLARVEVDVRGADSIEWSGPLVVMANHTSLYDIPVLFVAIPRSVRFLSKVELRRVPILGQAMQASGFVFVDRGRHERARRSIDVAADQVRRGQAVVIFPEGTRSEDGRLLPFKKGGFVLAIKSGARIVPAWVEGTRDVLPKHARVPLPGRVEVRFGAPVDASAYTLDTKDALMSEVRMRMEALARGDDVDG